MGDPYEAWNLSSDEHAWVLAPANSESPNWLQCYAYGASYCLPSQAGRLQCLRSSTSERDWQAVELLLGTALAAGRSRASAVQGWSRAAPPKRVSQLRRGSPADCLVVVPCDLARQRLPVTVSRRPKRLGEGPYRCQPKQPHWYSVSDISLHACTCRKVACQAET